MNSSHTICRHTKSTDSVMFLVSKLCITNGWKYVNDMRRLWNSTDVQTKPILLLVFGPGNEARTWPSQKTSVFWPLEQVCMQNVMLVSMELCWGDKAMFVVMTHFAGICV